MERFDGHFFDENQARILGLRPRGLKIVFFVLLSACVVAAMQTVGAFLVVAMVITREQLRIYCAIVFPV